MTNVPHPEPASENHELIERLSQSLGPARSLNPLRLWGLLGVLLVLGCVMVLGAYRLRPEWFMGVEIYWQRPMIWLKPLYFFLLALISSASVFALSRPNGTLGPWTLCGIGFGLLLLIIGVISTLWMRGPEEWALQMAQPFLVSVSTIFGGGLVVFGVFWALWLRRCASAWPRLLGALGAVSAGSLMATAYAFHCPQDSPLYLGVFYFGSLFALGLIGAFVGERTLTW